MEHETIIIFFETNQNYPRQSDKSRVYWTNRLKTLHQQMMAQKREHANAIIQCKREYDASRGNPKFV